MVWAPGRPSLLKKKTDFGCVWCIPWHHIHTYTYMLHSIRCMHDNTDDCEIFPVFYAECGQANGSDPSYSWGSGFLSYQGRWSEPFWERNLMSAARILRIGMWCRIMVRPTIFLFLSTSCLLGMHKVCVLSLGTTVSAANAKSCRSWHFLSLSPCPLLIMMMIS